MRTQSQRENFSSFHSEPAGSVVGHPLAALLSAGVTAAAVILTLLAPRFQVLPYFMIYVVAIVVGAVWGGRRFAWIAVAITAIVSLPAFFWMSSSDFSWFWTFLLFIGLAALTAELVSWLHRQALRAERRDQEHLRQFEAERQARSHVEGALWSAEKLAGAGRIAGTISHELNNPLEAVINLLHLLRQNPTINDGAREQVQLAEQEVARMAQIVKQTLGFYREASAPVWINVADVLDQILWLYRPKVMRNHVQIVRRYDFRGDVRGFPGEMRQVLSNLITNAAEAMASGGMLWLRVRAGADWRNPKVQGLRVLVCDNGPGIQPQHLRQIFHPFFTTKGDAGTGLGLWVTEGIVRKHGGSIRVHSSTRPGRSGTCFSVFLPAELRHSSPRPQIQQPSAA